jgi:BON domain-containing protein
MEFNREKQLSLALGAGLGAGLMFVLNPARRRAPVRNKTVRALARERLTTEPNDPMDQRFNCVGAEILARKLPPPTDHQLEKRVRSELGNHIEHGWTIEVIAEDGFVVLRGNVLQNQLEDAVSTARDVHGVRKVWSEMGVRKSPGNGLQLQS